MKLPSEEHFALITTELHYVPGDERSRTVSVINKSIKYESFDTEKLLLERLRCMSVSDIAKAYVIRAIPLKVSTKVSVELT